MQIACISLPLPPHHVCFRKIQNGLSFWYQLTWVVPDKGRNMVVVVVVVQKQWFLSAFVCHESVDKFLTKELARQVIRLALSVCPSVYFHSNF